MRLIVVFSLISAFAFSQQSDQQIAYQYYINAEYEKAVAVYEDLINSHFSVAYYNPYYTSLLKVEDYKGAEYLAKNLARKYPKELQYQLAVIIAQEKSKSRDAENLAFKIMKCVYTLELSMSWKSVV